MKTGPRVRALHAHAWMATKLIDAYASCTLTRELKNSQVTRTRQPRVRVGALAPQAQNWHNTGTTLGKIAGHLVQRIDAPAHTTRTRGWCFLEERRGRAKCAYAQGVILLKIF